MSEAALDVRLLQKSFGDREVLRQLSLTMPRGQLLGLVGPNGAGKSTFLRTLIGLVQPSAGQVQVLGLDPRRDALSIRRRVSYLPGETGVYLQMTGRQFLDFALGFYPALQQDLHQRLLDQFALPLGQRVRNYSAGMKQKLALIATLVPDVELYLLDEPDRALDAQVRFFLRDVLLDLKHRGKTVLLSSHHLSEVETLADRLEFLLDGTFVPAERIAAARAQLRRRPRLRLQPGHELPAGCRVLRREPDQMLVVETHGEPMTWLRSLPENAVQSVEVGVDRLEDLYQLLLEPAVPHGDDEGRR